MTITPVAWVQILLHDSGTLPLPLWATGAMLVMTEASGWPMINCIRCCKHPQVADPPSGMSPRDSQFCCYMLVPPWISPVKLLHPLSPEYVVIFLNDYYELHIMLITCVWSHSSFYWCFSACFGDFSMTYFSSAYCVAGFGVQLELYVIMLEVSHGLDDTQCTLGSLRVSHFIIYT